MKRVPLIKQHDERDCGAASLSMILQYHHKKLPMANIRETIKVDQYGASIYGLLDGSEQFGMSAQAMEGDAEAVWNAIKTNDVPLPAIVRIVNQFGYEHYIVVCGIKKNLLYINDPGEGRKKLNQDSFKECFLGQIVVFQPTEAFKKENLRKGSLQRFTSMITHQKKLLLCIGVLSIGITGIGLLGAGLFQFLIDNILSNASDLSLAEEGLETFAMLITLIGGLYLVKMAVQMLRGKLLTTMSKNIDLPLMLGYYDHVTELPMNFFDTRKTGEIISRFNDAGKIREAISGVTLTLMIDVVMVLVCGVVLWQRSRELFLVAVIIFLLYLLTSLLYVKPLDKFNRDLMEQNAQFSSYLKESIDGIETVKSTQAENAVKEKTHTLFLTFLNRNITGSLLSLSKDSIIECITSVGTLVLLWVGAVNILNGEMTIGSLVTFLTLLNYFLDPIQNLVELQSTLQTALVAADRLNDVLALSTEQSGEEIPQNGLESISFDNVTFRYGNREQVLTGLTFSAKKGEQIALVGESGCGKSTATKLLMGFYPPESGTVKIGNTPIQALSLRWLRNQTAYVPQNTFLFCDTVKNNLLLGLDKDHMPTDKELEQVLDACGCEFIKKMPLGLDSMLEENGSNLSGGQRQRLAIARALLRKPKLLILDEATSALDTITEYRIQNALRELCPEMIVVMVAHRLSTVKHCSQILVMNHGAITERGTHEELLSKNHSYAQLWNRQNAA
jgi:ATP-binding cassette subfamily B protein